MTKFEDFCCLSFFQIHMSPTHDMNIANRFSETCSFWQKMTRQFT